MIELNYAEHLAIGVGFGSVILLAFNSLTINSFIFVALCSILPDIDHPKSKISQLLYFLVFVLSFLFIQPIMQKYAGLLISVVVTLLFSMTIMALWLAVKPRHRGLTHSLFFAIIFMLAAVYFEGFIVGVSGFAAYVSHLIVDRI